MVLAATVASQAGSDAKPATSAKPYDAQSVFALAAPAVMRVQSTLWLGDPVGSGTGFFISPDGLFVTNYHVIKDGNWVNVIHPSGSVFEVEGVRGVSEAEDVVVLKLKVDKISHLQIGGSSTIDVGAHVFAIGNPKGLENTISEGIISGKRETEGDRFLLQTTAAISPGSSGGPLIDTKGRAVGVTTSFLAGGQNLNFAVPTAVIQRLLEKETALQPLTSVTKKIELPPAPKANTEEPKPETPQSAFNVERQRKLWERIEADKPQQFRTRLRVTCADPEYKALLESKFLGALRGLSGVEMSDTEPTYDVSVVALPEKTLNGDAYGVSASILITVVGDGEMRSDGAFHVTNCTVLEHHAVQWGRDRIGGGVEAIVAAFDANWVESSRKLDSYLREKAKAKDTANPPK
jgi:hypothetical protein